MRKILHARICCPPREARNLAIPLHYRYVLRYLSADQLRVELSDNQGVGPDPLVWVDQATATLSEPPPPGRLAGLVAPRRRPRYTQIQFSFAAWLEVLRSGDLIEIGQQQGHRWIQLTRRGRLELRCGDLQGAELPEFVLENAFQEDGSLHLRSSRCLRLQPGQTATLDGYRVYLHRLGGPALGICNVTSGWLARDTYFADWMMATFEKVGETGSQTA